MPRVDGVGKGIEQAKAQEPTTSAPLISRKAQNNLEFEGVLKKIEKKGKISADNLDKLSVNYKGGKEALVKALVDNKIVPQASIDKLLAPKTFMESIFGKAKVELPKENIKQLSLTIKLGSTKYLAQRKEEMSKLDNVSDLKGYIKDKGISKEEYGSICKFIPFKVQSELAQVSLKKTIESPGTDSKATTLKKIFYSLHEGDLKIRAKDSKVAEPWPHSMADALARGGRVCMVVDSAKADDFVKFLKSENSNERTYLKVPMPSSHGIDHDTNDTGMGFSEAKLKGSKPIFNRTDNSGINLAVGGAGEGNLFGDKISDDGHFGHLLIAYDKSKEPAVIMIGLENSGPGMDNQYGGSHDIDCHANDVSAVGCPKWKDSGAGRGDTPDGLGGMLLDLRGDKSSTIISGYDKGIESFTTEQLVGGRLSKQQIDSSLL